MTITTLGNKIVTKFNKVAAIVAVVALIASYSHDAHAITKYKAIPLSHASNTTKKGTLTFSHYRFTRNDCDKFLGRYQILSKGYQPIQVTITNNTANPMSVSLKDFSLPTVHYTNVAAEVHFDTTKRVVSWGIASLFVWPFIIPTIIEAVESPRANDRMLIDYEQKSLGNETIQPYSTINKLIFTTKEHCNDQFSFALADTTNNKRYTLSTAQPTLEITPKVVTVKSSDDKK